MRALLTTVYKVSSYGEQVNPQTYKGGSRGEGAGGGEVGCHKMRFLQNENRIYSGMLKLSVAVH